MLKSIVFVRHVIFGRLQAIKQNGERIIIGEGSWPGENVCIVGASSVNIVLLVRI